MSARHTDASFQPAAGVMACVLPGLGYLWFGDTKRALCVLTGVMGLFLSGLLVGGIDSIDRVEDKWWFLLQAGNGPVAFVVDGIHQNQFKVPNHSNRRTSPLPNAAMNPGGNPPSYAKSVGRVNEAGMLMTALAGMMNIIAIIDCLWHAPATRRREDRSAPVTLRVGGTAPASEATR